MPHHPGVNGGEGEPVRHVHSCIGVPQQADLRLYGELLRARRPEGQQQLDQVQHVDRAVLVDVLGFAAGDGGQSEAERQVYKKKSRDA